MVQFHQSSLVSAPPAPRTKRVILSRKPWLIFAVILPIYVCTMFYRMAPTVLALDIGRDLGLATPDLAFMSGATMLGYGLMQLPSGLLADAWGGRKTLFLFTMLVGLSTIVFALSSSPSSIAVARFCTGLGLAATVPCMAILARWFPSGMFSRVASLMFASGTCGTLLASSPLVAASGAVGWRAVMLGCGVFSLLLAGMVWFFVRDSPDPTPVRAKSGNRQTWSGLLHGLKTVLTTRAFWPLCVSYSLLLLIYFSFAGLWWGPYLMQACGLSKMQAGNILFIGTFASIPAMPLLATLSDKLRSRRAVLIPCSIVVLLVMASMSLGAGRLSMPWLAVLAVIFTSACGMGAVALAAGKELFPVEMMGTATGCLNTIPAMGAALHQKLFGALLGLRLEAAGQDYAAAYGQAMYLNILFLGVAVLAALFIRETFPRD